MTNREYQAWAFRARHFWHGKFHGDPFLAGRYCFRPAVDGGIGVALFETRAAARRAARESGLRGKVVRVRVSVEVRP